MNRVVHLSRLMWGDNNGQQIDGVICVCTRVSANSSNAHATGHEQALIDK